MRRLRRPPRFEFVSKHQRVAGRNNDEIQECRGDQPAKRDDRKRRQPYAAVGINLSRVFRDMGLPKVGKFFNYYQAPYVYLATGDQ